MNRFALLTFVAAAFVGTAHAQFIVDTGPGIDSPIGALVGGPDNPFGTPFEQSFAAQFSISEAETITSAQTWLAAYPVFPPGPGPGPYELHTSIYSNVPGLPNGIPGTSLFSAAFTYPLCAGPSQGSCSVGWQGPTGLSWNLSPGTYWLVVEGVDGDTGLAGLVGGEPHPLEFYTFNDQGQGWNQAGIGFALQIAGTPSGSVPEPSTVSLFLAVLLAYGAFVWCSAAQPDARGHDAHDERSR